MLGTFLGRLHGGQHAYAKKVIANTMVNLMCSEGEDLVPSTFQELMNIRGLGGSRYLVSMNPSF